jgi:hypothetical protein
LSRVRVSAWGADMRRFGCRIRLRSSSTVKSEFTSQAHFLCRATIDSWSKPAASTMSDARSTGSLTQGEDPAQGASLEKMQSPC